MSEVLVTLTILGILASIIVPSVVQRYSDRQTVTAVKRAYSILDNAIQQMYVIEGNPYTWGLTGLDNNQKAELFGEKLSHYLDVKKYCGTKDGCFQYGWAADGSKWKKGHPFYMPLNSEMNPGWGYWTEFDEEGKMILKNGMHISNASIPIDTYGIGNIRVDINGQKGPNRYGYDVFFFNVNEKGINNKIKNGVTYANNNGYIFNPTNCYYKSTQNNHLNGISCSTWIMKHGNLDYKYRDVSAEW